MLSRPRPCFFALLLCVAPAVATAGALPNSNSVTTQPEARPVSRVGANHWTVAYGNAAMGLSAFTAPDSSGTMEFVAQQAGSVVAQHTLQTVVDTRPYDTFSFWAQASATHVGDFVTLVDSNGRKRWYSLLLWGPRGWQKPTYWIDSYAGQESGFDSSAVAKIRFGQAGQRPADVLRYSAVTFEHNVVSHGDALASWYPDVGSATFSIVRDGAAGSPTSVKAEVVANAHGQADVAINLLPARIVWDWSGKSFLTFYFKDSETTASHYFLIYDKTLNYRQWVFSNPVPGEWMRVTANLADSYFDSAPVDLSHIVYFEVGVFGGNPGATYTFQVDEVAAY